MLEGAAYPWSDFVTFTFREDPPGDRALQVREAQLLIKRIRERLAPARFRHFTVGEYGKVGGRFHYHSILFSVRQDGSFYESVWPYGFSYVGLSGLTASSAAYVAGYAAKSYLEVGSCRPVRLISRGIGKVGAVLIAAASEPYSVACRPDGLLDAPSCVQLSGGRAPLDRYVRNRIRRLWGKQELEPEDAARDRKARQGEVSEGERRQAGWRAAKRLELMKAKGSL